MESCDMKYKSLFCHYRIGIFKRKTLVGEGIYYMYAAPTHLQGVIITILMNIGYFLCQRKALAGAGRDKGQNPLAKAAKDTPRAINLAINGYAAQCGCSLSVIESAESAYEFHHADILANSGKRRIAVAWGV